jgi:4-aminobutyrate aminotransferase-like enzyme
MLTTQAVAPAADRAAVVHQDLQNALHPMVPHRQLEAKPLVIVEGRGSTVVAVDGMEYLDATDADPAACYRSRARGFARALGRCGVP